MYRKSLPKKEKNSERHTNGLNEQQNFLSDMRLLDKIEIENEIAAYFCLSNDGLTRTTIPTAEEKTLWNKVGRKIPNSKRRKTYPAVKIGRLAVNQKFSGLGLGTQILLSVREMYISEPHHAGCRFVTVDAYRSALSFYERNDFKYLTTKDIDDETRIMYFDLKAI
jgi:predicted GNAT family N-acyltransferase